MKKQLFFILSVFILVSCNTKPESLPGQQAWHGQTRELRYSPDGDDFVIQNGKKRFNRALYGTNSGFRVEAGDLPEFGFYMTRLGGTLRLGLMDGDSSIWMIDARNIEMRYNAGSIRYKISDPILGKGIVRLEVLALHSADGMIMHVTSENVPSDVRLVWGFGGATDKRFPREGDLGADPESSFYLKAENCLNNDIFLKENGFQLYYGSGRSLSDNEVYENDYQPSAEELAQTKLLKKKRISGLFPERSRLKVGDAAQQESPMHLFQSEADTFPVVVGSMDLVSDEQDYFILYNPDTGMPPTHKVLPQLFAQTDSIRQSIANRFWIKTPDPYLNAAAAQLSTAADAVWDGSSYMHGAIAWRMALPGWRGAYAADWLGSHDRAREHLRGYFAAQYTEPETGPVEQDPNTHLARHKEVKGTSMFTSGYISRYPNRQSKPHHYDMNLVFINQLLWHFKWTGDTLFLKESWPVIERHIAWEKRVFDPDNDGLYNAYAAIWASDALQYSGGAVTHSSAYNYNTNKQAAKLAGLIGIDPTPYEKEADKILSAVNDRLWMQDKGWYAEYQDLLGKKLLHPTPAVWTIYHAIDEGIADAFQSFQSTRYIDEHIPHIPVSVDPMTGESLYTISTSNWMPYTWSINNVALAEVLHTALAYWQAGRSEKAYQLMKGTIFDYMYLGSSPGNYGQLSYLDAFRGELYRDFADPVGMASRAFVEGLFGVKPNLFSKEVTIQPGWPGDWPYAQIWTSDMRIDYSSKGAEDKYIIESGFEEEVELQLILKAKAESVKNITVNGETVQWNNDSAAIGVPKIMVRTGLGRQFTIKIEWSGKALILPEDKYLCTSEKILDIDTGSASIIDIYDPQGVFSVSETGNNILSEKLLHSGSKKTFFVQLNQGPYQWWHPVGVTFDPLIDITFKKDAASENLVQMCLKNNAQQPVEGTLSLNDFTQEIGVDALASSENISVPIESMHPGTNVIKYTFNEEVITKEFLQWDCKAGQEMNFETVDLSSHFNDRVIHIFREQYYTPRSPYTTLSIPVQGIGDWCSYRENEEINDEGLLALAGDKNQITSPQGIPFEISGTPGDNIIFTSQWDNYPNSVSLDLEGKARHLYLLMAGSVHHMQIRMVNGIVRVEYSDGSADSLQLISPENWWPIEQDYYQDGYAFNTGKPQPPRLYLKTGDWHLDSYDVLDKNKTIKIEGGAAQLLDLPLDASKELERLYIETYSNDIVIGLMGGTLVR